MAIYPMSGVERETQFLYNAVEPDVTLSTFSNSMKKKMIELAKERPEEVTIVRGTVDTDDEMLVTFPKKWLKIRPPRVLTEEQKAELQARGKALYELAQAKKNQSVFGDEDEEGAELETEN